MKLIHIIIAVVLLVAGWFAWKRLPGVRVKVENTVEEYGGWTQEARVTDPVGFLTFAEGRFREDLVEFASSRTELAHAGERARTEVERHTALIGAAEELADQFRIEFKQAEQAASWPITFKGAQYERASFLEQVEDVLAEKRSSLAVRETYRTVVVTAAERDSQLRDRITSTKATIQQLAAQKELVRVDKLTSEADDLLLKIDELLGGNQAAIIEETGPVRTLEELLSASNEAPAAEDETVDALKFLQGN